MGWWDFRKKPVPSTIWNEVYGINEINQLKIIANQIYIVANRSELYYTAPGSKYWSYPHKIDYVQLYGHEIKKIVVTYSNCIILIDDGTIWLMKHPKLNDSDNLRLVQIPKHSYKWTDIEGEFHTCYLLNENSTLYKWEEKTAEQYRVEPIAPIPCQAKVNPKYATGKEVITKFCVSFEYGLCLTNRNRVFILKNHKKIMECKIWFEDKRLCEEILDIECTIEKYIILKLKTKVLSGVFPQLEREPIIMNVISTKVTKLHKMNRPGIIAFDNLVVDLNTQMIMFPFLLEKREKLLTISHSLNEKIGWTNHNY